MSASTLKEHLLSTLQKKAKGKRDFELHVLRSAPKRSYSVFPWASLPETKIYCEQTLVILSECVEKDSVYAQADVTAGSQHTSENDIPQTTFVPIFGLEVATYVIPSTSCALIYVSKVDTTGLYPTSPAPSRILTTAFLEYQLLHPPQDVQSVRIHVFARAQSMYLFPGSIDNKAKRVLDDKGLNRWWRDVLGEATCNVHEHAESEKEITTRMFYLLAGMDYAESLPFLPAPSRSEDPSAPNWQYGHPYNTISPPLPLPAGHTIPTLNDLIPAFSDDPKSRYLTSVTSCPLPPAGDEGDYDDVMEHVAKLSKQSTALFALKTKEIEEQRNEERRRLLENTKDPDTWWLLMGERQECRSGHIVGFLVVTRDAVTSSTFQMTTSHTTSTSQDEQVLQNPETREHPLLTSANRTNVTTASAALTHKSYVRLWSQIHNVDYSSLSKSSEAYEKWKGDVHTAVVRDGSVEDAYHGEAFGSVSVNNPLQNASTGVKRPDPPKQVNTLMVKKKKKTVA